jgi:hypothetical protein
MGGRIQSESVAAFNRNHWPVWAGICIFCRANSTKAWETGLINRLPREEVEEVRRSARETPCERAQRYARRYGPEDRYVQIHLSWCEECKKALAEPSETAN